MPINTYGRRISMRWMSLVLFIGGIVAALQLFISDAEPVLELSQLEATTGVVHSVRYAGKNRNRYLYLMRDNGVVVEYSADSIWGDFDGIGQRVGRPVTIYSQDAFRIFQFGYVKNVMEIKDDGKYVIGYSPAKVRDNLKKSINLFVIPALLILFSVFLFIYSFKAE